MIDIHAHILPGIDDGPSDIEESVLIIEKGIREGIKAFVLTPHVKDDSDWDRFGQIAERFIAFKDYCYGRSLNVDLILGAELLIVPDLAKKIKLNPAVTFGGKGRYALVELPRFSMPSYCDEVFFNLRSQGVTPILAHPERYGYLKKDRAALDKWAENGILFQLNAGSLTGRYGFWIKRKAKWLLRNGYAHFISSDAHGYSEKYSLIRHASVIAEKVAGGQKGAENLFGSNLSFSI